MKTFIYFITLLLFGCSKFNKEFDNEQNRIIRMHNIGDTLWYESQNRDLDTFYINKIDSVYAPNRLGVYPSSNYVIIFIKHLPVNHWKGDYLGKGIYEGQPFIQISKAYSKKVLSHYFSIGYRKFYCVLSNNRIKPQIDTLTHKYIGSSDYTINKGEVVEVYFDTINALMKGYKLMNGDQYRLKKISKSNFNVYYDGFKLDTVYKGI